MTAAAKSLEQQKSQKWAWYSVEMGAYDAEILLNTKAFTPIVFGFTSSVSYVHSELSSTLSPSALSGDEKPSETKV